MIYVGLLSNPLRDQKRPRIWEYTWKGDFVIQYKIQDLGDFDMINQTNGTESTTVVHTRWGNFQ